MTYVQCITSIGILSTLIHACITLNCSVFLTQDMRTALYYASKDGHVEVVEELLKAGAYVNYYDTVNCMTLIEVN